MGTKLKLLLMVLVSTVATIISNSGIPDNSNDWGIVGITLLGVTLTYVAKNWLFKSGSNFLSLDFRDVMSGLLLAMGAAVSDFSANLIMSSPVDYGELWKLILVVVLGYFSKTLFQKPLKE